MLLYIFIMCVFVAGAAFIFDVFESDFGTGTVGIADSAFSDNRALFGGRIISLDYDNDNDSDSDTYMYIYVWMKIMMHTCICIYVYIYVYTL